MAPPKAGIVIFLVWKVYLLYNNRIYLRFQNVLLFVVFVRWGGANMNTISIHSHSRARRFDDEIIICNSCALAHLILFVPYSSSCWSSGILSYFCKDIMYRYASACCVYFTHVAHYQITWVFVVKWQLQL